MYGQINHLMCGTCMNLGIYVWADKLFDVWYMYEPWGICTHSLLGYMYTVWADKLFDIRYIWTLGYMHGG